MKKIYALILFITTILSLNAQSYVRFGAKEKYFLTGDEKQMPIDSGVLTRYNPLNPDLTHQVPLNRYIKAADYDLFIGLAVYDTPEQIVNFYRNQKNYNILNYSVIRIKRVKYYFIFAKFAGKYNLKVIFKTRKSRMTVVMNYLSSNSELLMKLYKNKKIIFDKIGKKYKYEDK